MHDGVLYGLTFQCGPGDFFIEAQFRHEILQPSVLVQELLVLPDLIGLHIGVLALPPVKGLLGNPHPPSDVRHGIPNSACLRTATICSTE